MLLTKYLKRKFKKIRHAMYEPSSLSTEHIQNGSSQPVKDNYYSLQDRKEKLVEEIKAIVENLKLLAQEIEFATKSLQSTETINSYSSRSNELYQEYHKRLDKFLQIEEKLKCFKISNKGGEVGKEKSKLIYPRILSFKKEPKFASLQNTYLTNSASVIDNHKKGISYGPSLLPKNPYHLFLNMGNNNSKKKLNKKSASTHNKPSFLYSKTHTSPTSYSKSSFYNNSSTYFKKINELTAYSALLSNSSSYSHNGFC